MEISFEILKQKLNEEMVKINTSDLFIKADVLLIYNGYYLPFFDLVKHYILNPKIQIIYLNSDSDVVLPFNSDSNLLKLINFISKIITYKDEIINNYDIKKLYLGEIYSSKSLEKIDFNEKKRLVMIQSNKLSTSINETYSLRQNIIEHYNLKNESFDLYGRGWNTNRNYKGQIKGLIQDKYPILSEYKFAFAIENNANEKGYFTEKAMDCLHCGVIPIYLGATNIEDYLPNGTYIDFRGFGSLDDLDNYLNEMSKKEYEDRIEKIKNFLTESWIYKRTNLYLFDLLNVEILKNTLNKKKKNGLVLFILKNNILLFSNYLILKYRFCFNSLLNKN